jgi:transmembrane sensor
MNDLQPPLKEALDDSLSEAEIQRMWRYVRAKGTTKRVWAPARWAMAGAVTAFVVCALLWLVAGRQFGALDQGALAVRGGAVLLPSSTLTSAPGHEALSLSDGSTIQLAPEASLEILENSGRVFLIHLRHGLSYFEVKPGGPRRWVIECGLATVEVVGTHFSIDRTGNGLSVRVSRGVVLVRGERVPDHVRRLAAGEEMRLEGPASAMPMPAMPTPATPMPMSAMPTPAMPTPAMPTPAMPMPAPAATQPVRAASSGLTTPGVSPSRPPQQEPSSAERPSRSRSTDLAGMLADVDEARGRGALDRAATLLRAVMHDGAGTPHGAVAAFTLARMEIAKAPGQAATDIEAALAGPLPAALREDAEARLVEAHTRAHNPDRARAAAARYEREYPGGRHAEEVKNWAADP